MDHVTKTESPGLSPKEIAEIFDWLEKNERSQRWLARHIERSPEHVGRLLMGQHKPHDSTIRKIYEVTSIVIK